MKIDFYNLEKRPFDTSVCQILQKAYASKNNVIIKVKDKEKQEYLDKMLWELDAKSWLPHGTTDKENQPIYITPNIDKDTNVDILMIIDNSDIPIDTNFSRCLYVFNGKDNEALEIARNQYKLFLAKKYEIQYHNL